MIFIWPVPANRRRSGGDNSTIRSWMRLSNKRWRAPIRLLKQSCAKRKRSRRRNCWKRVHSYRSPRWVCLTANGHRRMVFSDLMRWTRRSWVWMARIIRKRLLVCSPELISILGRTSFRRRGGSRRAKRRACRNRRRGVVAYHRRCAALLQYAGQLSDARSVTANS